MASAFSVSPFLNSGTANCSSPVFSTPMNGFSSGNPANPSRARWAQGWTTSVTANNNHYFIVTLSAATFANVALTQIILDELRSGTGPRMCQVMVSVDGGPFTLLWQGVIPDNTNWRNRNITSATSLTPMPSFNNTLTVIFQGFASEATTGSWRVDNVRFFAEITNLPISLLFFTGEERNGSAELKWSTATETGNDYFTISRSKDGDVWEEVGRVSGAGTSTSRRDYSFTDAWPHKGVNYYRLSQTDFDGTERNEGVVVVRLEDFGNAVNVFDLSGREVHKMKNFGIYILCDEYGRRRKVFIHEQ